MAKPLIHDHGGSKEKEFAAQFKRVVPTLEAKLRGLLAPVPAASPLPAAAAAKVNTSMTFYLIFFLNSHVFVSPHKHPFPNANHFYF